MGDTNMYLGAAISAVRATLDQPDLTDADKDELALIYDQLLALFEARREEDAPRYP